MSLIAAAVGRFAAPDRRTMAVACGVHGLHDGFTDLLYVLLPLWQAEFGLGYGRNRAVACALCRGDGRIPGAGGLARRAPRRTAGPGPRDRARRPRLSPRRRERRVRRTRRGAGPRRSRLERAAPDRRELVSEAFSSHRSRPALAGYNFSGDLGKMVLPAVTAWLLTLMPWRAATAMIGVGGLVAAVAILAVRGVPGRSTRPREAAGESGIAGWSRLGRGFSLLLAIAMIDSATRMGFLTFLPFLLKSKGVDLPMIGIALTLIFAGGAAGKLACGWLGARLGVVRATFVTEGLTAAGIRALLPLPLAAGLVVLPVIGMALNGTSSVLYGTVPVLVAPARRQRASSIFYTGGVGAGALAPVLYGLLSDLADVATMMVLVAGIVLVTLPLAWRLGPYLRARYSADRAR